MKLITFRIGRPYWLLPASLETLFAVIDRYPGVVDDMVWFNQDTHAPLDLDVYRRRVDRLGQVIAEARSRGMQSGVEVLTIIGHHEENLPLSLKSDSRRVVGADGVTSQGSFCPADTSHYEYIRQQCRIFAQVDGDYIWPGDDIRMFGHMPTVATCFCDHCVADFGRLVGRQFDRTGLVQALQDDPAPGFELRHAWQRRNGEVMAGLFRVMEQAIHEVRPELPIGFMTGDRFYEGYGFEQWAEILSGPNKLEVRWRPGGGFYSDEYLMGLVDKAHQTGRQISRLPDWVTNIPSEIENFPYQRLRKSVWTTVIEAAAHMAAGATGPAFNIMGQSNESLDEYEPFISEIHRARPFYEVMHTELGRSPCEGVWPAWKPDAFVLNGVDGRSWHESSGYLETLNNPYVLGELGIPLCYSRRNATVTAMSNQMPMLFSADELKEIFSGGVLLDAGSLETMHDLGFGDWCGARVAEKIPFDMAEKLTTDDINGPLAPGRKRDCRQSFLFWREDAYRLEPLADGVRVLAELFNYEGATYDRPDRMLGACMTAFENSLGGRVVVSGYYPWKLTHNLGKTQQMKEVCQWLSRDTQPLKIETFAKVVPWVRRDRKGRRAFVLLNASLDPIDELSVLVAERVSTFRLHTLGGKTLPVPTEPVDDSPYVRLRLKSLAPWSIHLVTAAE